MIPTQSKPTQNIKDTSHQKQDEVSVELYTELYDKIHRITTAIWVATRHIPENDIIHTSLRHNAMSFMDSVGYIRHTKDNSGFFYTTLLSHIENTIARVRLAEQLGYMSKANARLLEGELTHIFRLSERMSQMSFTIQTVRELDNGEESIKDILESIDSGLRLPVAVTTEHTPPEVSLPTHQGYGQSRHTVVTPNVPQVKSKSGQHQQTLRQNPPQTETRRSQVLSFIRNNGRISMRELADAMPAVSEKTLQRTLVDLIDSGDISRIGDRRWSHYEAAMQAGE
jgi:hypothetical protein